MGKRIDINLLKDGDTFNSINGMLLCEKYIVPVRNSNPGGKAPEKSKFKLQDLMIENQFRFHTNTTHFAKSLSNFSLNTEVIITRKLHGSSLILSNVLVRKQLNLRDRFFKFLGANISDKEYGIIWSSGKPKSNLPKGIESSSNNWTTKNPSFYKDDIWKRAYREMGSMVEKGVSIYAEIVGEGIQGSQFTYNQEYGIYVYRITQTSIDGNVVEFSWEQLKKYCDKYGLNYVQEYFVGKVSEMVSSVDDLLNFLQDKYLNKSYEDCKIDEGIVIRVRDTDELYKLKSPNFIKMESDNQENGIEEFES